MSLIADSKCTNQSTLLLLLFRMNGGLKMLRSYYCPERNHDLAYFKQVCCFIIYLPQLLLLIKYWITLTNILSKCDDRRSKN